MQTLAALALGFRGREPDMAGNLIAKHTHVAGISE
ncbi:hypothetical protein BOSEA31B_11478 [Hyphomicrobiales bacterium]|nr:hypothetical protein BOSEA31B_11478 [Hyphomicrobiales bacterium]CAH1697274.1 hypothetical protein BOSEA1005_10311 [Hyphomicrobiales bacterium]CAI0342841.1 hypothetical protein BO1005MUT1_10134 [Hyphomicrobiales bacterium]